MASSVWEPGNQMALMMKLPVASCGCNTRWSDTEPVLLNVSTWQSWRREEQEQSEIKLMVNSSNKSTHQSSKKVLVLTDFFLIYISYTVVKAHYCILYQHPECWLSDLEAAHSQVVFITGVSSEAQNSERNRSRGQPGERQLPLAGIGLF